LRPYKRGVPELPFDGRARLSLDHRDPEFFGVPVPDRKQRSILGFAGDAQRTVDSVLQRVLRDLPLAVDAERKQDPLRGHLLHQEPASAVHREDLRTDDLSHALEGPHRPPDGVARHPHHGQEGERLQDLRQQDRGGGEPGVLRRDREPPAARRDHQ
jgi:hypothetical protein